MHNLCLVLAKANTSTPAIRFNVYDYKYLSCFIDVKLYMNILKFS